MPLLSVMQPLSVGTVMAALQACGGDPATVDRRSLMRVVEEAVRDDDPPRRILLSLLGGRFFRRYSVDVAIAVALGLVGGNAYVLASRLSVDDWAKVLRALVACRGVSYGDRHH